MKSHVFEDWLSKGTLTEATKRYPQWCDVIDDRQSVSHKSLLFFIIECYPFASVIDAVRDIFLYRREY